MLKRSYLALSLFGALGLVTAMAFGSASLADDQKDKGQQAEKQKEDKQKEKEKEAEKASQRAFELSNVTGSESYLGVYLEEVTSDRARELKLSDERGAIVMKVVEGSPAEKAGLKENDVIVSFNGRRVDTVRELQRLLAETPAGRNVQFETIRAGGHHTIQATLTRRTPEVGWGHFDNSLFRGKLAQNEETLLKRNQDALRLYEKSRDWGKLSQGFGDFNFVAPGGFMYYRGSRLGIGVEALTDQLAEFFGVKSGHAVLVTEVTENSAAAKAGLKAGDVITAVDGQTIDGVPALLQAISRKQEGTIALTIVRNRSEQTITVTVEKSETRPFKLLRRGTRVLTGGSAVSIPS
jgi:membrane-associated protease RseP (regulator of RpoE activity)